MGIVWYYDWDTLTSVSAETIMNRRNQVDFNPEKKYAVITPQLSAEGVDRKWTANIDDAVRHASELLEQNKSRNEFLVIQVVKVVKRPLPTVEVTDVP